MEPTEAEVNEATRKYVSPKEVIRVLDSLDRRKSSKGNVRLRGGRLVVGLAGGAVSYRGSSWTERAYDATIQRRGGEPVELHVTGDPEDPYADAFMTMTSGEESWDYLSDVDPPEWAVRHLGLIGVEVREIPA